MIQKKPQTRWESAGKGKLQAGKETSKGSSSPLLSKLEQDRKGDGGICHQCSQVAHLGDLEMSWVGVFQWPSCVLSPVPGNMSWSSLQ